MFKKKYLSIIVFLLFLFISIGYSLLNSTLNINGKSSISKNNWDIHFDNIQIKDGSVEAFKTPIIENSITVDFEVALNLPGDYYEFTVDIVNDGTIDAMVESIKKEPELTLEQQKYLNYIIEYENGENISNKQIIKTSSIVRLKVKVEFREDINVSDLPLDGDILDLGFSLNYVQADESGNDVSIKMAQFTIDSKVYKAEEGMTWGEWNNSVYNTNYSRYYIKNNNLWWYSTRLAKAYVELDGVRVTTDDIIIDGASYIKYADPSLFGFTYKTAISQQMYESRDNMTWGEWINSDFEGHDLFTTKVVGEDVLIVTTYDYVIVTPTGDLVKANDLMTNIKYTAQKSS